MRLFYSVLIGLEIFLAVVFLTLGLLSLSNSISSSSHLIKTQGVVVKIVSDARAIVRFQTLYRDDVEVEVDNLIPSYNVGDRVPVKYASGDTGNASLATFANDMTEPLLFFWTALFLLILAFGSLFFRSYIRKRLQ